MITSRRRIGGDVGEAVLDGVAQKFSRGCASEVVGAFEIKICVGFEEERPQASEFGVCWVANNPAAGVVLLG